MDKGEIAIFEAIDIHTHFNHASKYDTISNEIYLVEIEDILRIGKLAGIGRIFCSTFASVLSDAEVTEENDYLYDIVENRDNLYQWFVIDPKKEETYIQAKKMLESKKCVGIKLHPPCHNYSLEDYGDKVFKFAAEYVLCRFILKRILIIFFRLQVFRKKIRKIF